MTFQGAGRTEARLRIGVSLLLALTLILPAFAQIAIGKEIGEIEKPIEKPTPIAGISYLQLEWVHGYTTKTTTQTVLKAFPTKMETKTRIRWEIQKIPIAGKFGEGVPDEFKFIQKKVPIYEEYQEQGYELREVQEETVELIPINREVEVVKEYPKQIQDRLKEVAKK